MSCSQGPIIELIRNGDHSGSDSSNLKICRSHETPLAHCTLVHKGLAKISLACREESNQKSYIDPLGQRGSQGIFPMGLTPTRGANGSGQDEE